MPKGYYTEARGSRRLFKDALIDVNQQILKDYGRRRGRMPKIDRADVEETFKKYGGRCVYCGVIVSPSSSMGRHWIDRARFRFYIPLTRGGEVSRDNLVLVCRRHRQVYDYRKRTREYIPNINSFADLIETLVIIVREREKFREEKDPEFFLLDEKIKRIKREINRQLEQIAIHSMYKSFNEDKPEEYRKFIEERSTVAEFIEMRDIKKLADSIKQIVTTEEYKIIREE